MSIYLLLATEDGLAICEPQEDGWLETRRGLAGQYLTSVIAREGVILAGGRDGIFRSDDAGKGWRSVNQGLDIRHIRWLAYHPQHSDFELAGTEPAGVFVSRDGGENWRSCPEVIEMRRQFAWSLPYSPEAGAVRGFAIQGERAYAAVEDGCVLVSNDGGEHWRLAGGSQGRPDHHPAPGDIHSDVHSIAVHPSSSDLVYAPTGGGFYRSFDGGRSWERRYPNCYCRAVWVDWRDPEHLILGPADGVDRNGRIEESRDGGQHWSPASLGLEVPWPNSMVERFFPVGQELLALLSNGQVFASGLKELAWKRLLPDLPRVNAAATLED